MLRLLFYIAFTLSTFVRSDTLEDIHKLIEKSCLDCHDDTIQKGNLRLDNLASISSAPGSSETWLKIYDRVASGEMPPKKKAFSAEEIERFTRVLGRDIEAFENSRHKSTGRVPIRRLSASEYENSVRDLLYQPHLKVIQYLPEDPSYHGISNVAAQQQMAYTQVSQYLQAAESSLQAAVNLRPRPDIAPKRFMPTSLLAHKKAFPKAHVVAEEKLVLTKQTDFNQGSWVLFYSPKEPGYYTVRVRLQSVQIADSDMQNGYLPATSPKLLPGRRKQTAVFAVNNGRFIKNVDVSKDEETFSAIFWSHGSEPISLRLTDLPLRGTKFQGGNPKSWDAVAISWAEIEGPAIRSWPPESHRALFGNLPVKRWQKGKGLLPPRMNKIGTGEIRRNFMSRFYVESTDPFADSKRLLTAFMERAYRRPVDQEEVKLMQDRVLAALEDKLCFQDAMLIAYKAILCSPEFLFVREDAGALSGDALAVRLALYLWRSIPDQRLVDLGRSGELLKNQVLREEAERMLQDPRADRFIEDFTNQWLDLESIYATSPDRKLYPEYYSDTGLVEFMLAETQAYVQELLRKNLPIANIVKSDFTFLNERLAEHYGIPGVVGSHLRKVSLPKNSVRGGILTQGSMLKITANGFTTSPIKRGVWVLERILGIHLPPPPADAGSVEPDIRGAVTVREQLSKHSEVKSCATCHAKIDPPGFALESFDVLGAYRTRYRSIDKGKRTIKKRGDFRYQYKLGLKVDSADTFDGETFRGIRDFKKILVKKDRDIAKNILNRLLMHATGGVPAYTDRAVVEKILDENASSGYGMQSLILSLVETPMFLNK